ncbi:MAG: fibronectin type III domain-containing protein [Nocardioidaceae bacterium]
MLALVAGVLSVVGLWGAQAPASAVGDKDCGDFRTQKAAQIFFINHGGPQSDPHRLDEDGDGIACESNPCPCYFGSSAPGGGGGQPVVKPSSIVVTPSRSAGIAGEPLSLTVRVKPAVARSVTIQRKHDGTWRAIKRARTTARGTLVMKTEVAAASSTYRAVAPKTTSGSPRYRAATSRARVVRTQAQSARLTVPTTAEQGSHFTVTGTAKPARPGRGVELWTRAGAGASWTRVAKGTEDARGKETFRLAARTLGDHDYRLKVLPRSGAAGVTSTVRDVAVQDTVAPSRTRIVKVAEGDHALRFSWQKVSAGDLRGYAVFVGPEGGTLEEVKQVGPKRTTTTVSGLEAGVTYEVAVAAFDEVPNYARRSPVITAVPVDATSPATPTGLGATPGQGELSLTWNASPDSDVDHYEVQFEVAGSGTWSTSTTSTPSLTLTGLTDDTDYTVRVRAVDTAENASGWSAEVTARTLPPVDTTPPAVPTGLSVVGLGSASIGVSWDSVSDADLEGYVVEHATSVDGPWTSLPLTTSTTVTIDGLAPDTTYVVRVASRDTTGNESDWVVGSATTVG